VLFEQRDLSPLASTDTSFQPLSLDESAFADGIHRSAMCSLAPDALHSTGHTSG